MAKFTAGLILMYASLPSNLNNLDFSNLALVAGIVLFAFGVDEMFSKKK